MDVKNVSQFKQVLFDPTITTYDTTNLWTTTAGTPTIASNILRFNADGAYTKNTGLYGRYTFSLNVPTAPASGDDKTWGLKSLALGNAGALFFNIADDVLSFKIYNDLGVVIASETIAWDSDWTAAQTNFIIDWQPGIVSIMIGLPGVVPVTFKKWEVADDIPTMPQPIFIDNADSDNMDLTYWMIQGASQWNKPY